MLYFCNDILNVFISPFAICEKRKASIAINKSTLVTVIMINIFNSSVIMNNDRGTCRILRQLVFLGLGILVQNK